MLECVAIGTTWFTKFARKLEETTFTIPQVKNATTKQCAVDTVNRYVRKGAVSNSAVWQYLVSEDATFKRVRVTLRQFSAATSARSTFLSFDQLSSGTWPQRFFSFSFSFCYCYLFSPHSLSVVFCFLPMF